MSRSSRNPPTIVDIAKTLGVSAMTVSRALNGKAEVSADVKQRILDCAKDLGYRPNRWARSLVTQRSHMIGVVIPEIAHSFFAEVLSGAEDVLDQSGYDVLLCHSRTDPARERSEVEALTASHIDGLIVAPVQPEKSPELFLELENRDVPFVLVDRFFPGYDFPSVRLDDAAAGYEATRYLLNLGHRRIGHIAGPSFSPASQRRRGYLRALREYPDAIRDKALIVPGRFDIESGREAMTQLLAQTPRPTAVFAANDPEAVGAIWACRGAGLDVPRDISVIGAGNIEGVYHPNPFVTTIDWPRQELGRIAAHMLLARIDKSAEKKAGSHVFKPELLIRHSTAPPRR
jgi:DNA-binding LacI/PurR family transcriptional regulator